MVDEAKLDAIAEVVRKHWPEQIGHDELQHPALIDGVERARSELLRLLDLSELA
jgi:succinylarginine dihydrolase